MRTILERADVIAPLAATFRSSGFGGASLAVISERTGLGKGSLYNFFPGGKEEMAQAVLDKVSKWFQRHINEPLRGDGDSAARIEGMFAACEEYFGSHGLVCLFGAFALGQEQQRFEEQIRRYFDEWTLALSEALCDGGWDPAEATAKALEVVAGIQGALIIGRVFSNRAVFAQLLERLQHSTLTRDAA